MLQKLFNIRRGEESRAFLMITYIFLVISSLMIIKPVSHAQFLSQFGAKQLPFVFVLVAGFAALVSVLYGKLLRRMEFLRLIRRSLQVFIILLILIWGLLTLRYAEAIILYVFFISVSIFSVIATSQFWILANVIFNPREARRLFGFIGAGAIAGGILGGYLTKLLVSTTGSENLILVGASLLLLCDPLVRRVGKENPPARDNMNAGIQSGLYEKTDIALKMIRYNPHLFYLASIVLLSVIVAKFVDYEFNALAAERIHDEEQLTAFLGFWYSNLNVVSLLIQLFVTRQVVGVFGVGTSLMFLPFTILIGAVMVLVNPGLASAIFLKMGDGSLKNSIQKSGIELLSLPIPAEIRNPSRSFIDVFGDSFATGISGLLLMVLAFIFKIPVRYISIMILIFVILWLLVVKRVRIEYIHAFRKKIEPGIERARTQDLKMEKESVIGVMINILCSQYEDRILEVLRMTHEIQNDRLVPFFRKLIHHHSDPIKLEALRNLYNYEENYSDEVERMISHANPDVQTEALHYLFRHTGDNPIQYFLQYLDHPDENIRNAALLCAAQESRDNIAFKEAFHIRRRIENCLARIKTAHPDEQAILKSLCVQMIGFARIPPLNPWIYDFLKDESILVVEKAILAAGHTRDRTFLPVLMRHLIESKYQATVLTAISFFNMDVISLFIRWMSDVKEERIIRLRIPEIMANMGTQRAADALTEHLQNDDWGIRHEIIQSLNSLRRSHPDLRFDRKKISSRISEESQMVSQTHSLLTAQIRLKNDTTGLPVHIGAVGQAREYLIRELTKRLDKTLDTLFILLGLIYPPEDIDTVLLGMKSERVDTRMNSLEFLDNLLNRRVGHAVIPIVESVFIEKPDDRSSDRPGIAMLSEHECLSALLEGDDLQLKLIALSMIGALKSDQFAPQIRLLLSDRNSEIRRQAEITLKQLEMAV